MTFLHRISLIATLTLASTLRAEDTVDTSAQAAQAQNTEPAASASASATIAPIEPPSLIPPNRLPAATANAFPAMPVAPELEQLSAFFKQTSLGKEADLHRLQVETAKLKTHIRNDDELHRLKQYAFDAGTDLKRRHRLRTYYDRYYAKLRASATAADLQAYLDALAAVQKISLLQPRTRHETDEAEVLKLVAARAGAPTTGIGPLPTPPQAKVNDILRP